MLHRSRLAEWLGAVALIAVVAGVPALAELPAEAEAQAELPTETEAEAEAVQTIWQVAAFDMDGEPMPIKAIHDDGSIYEVVAVQSGDNLQLLDVKTVVGEGFKPVKVIVADERFAPVKAIDVMGDNIDIVAISNSGRMFNVKAVRRTGTILHLKVIGALHYFDIHAISPDGLRYDVKGVKLSDKRAEMIIGATLIHAHVKALPPPADKR